MTWQNASVPQESLSRQQREKQEAEASEDLAEKLDSLSRPLAERVLGRAIELDASAKAEAEEAAATIDYDMLKDIALEVGITEESLKRAILEQLDTEKDPAARPIERIMVPDAVRGGLVVPGTAEDVSRRMRAHAAGQGLTGVAKNRNQTVWSGGSGPPVETWTVTQHAPDRQLVEVAVETSSARKKAWRWVIGFLIISALFGQAFAPLIAMGVWFFAVSAIFSWVRRIGRRARKEINRALGSLVDAFEGDDDTPFNPENWLAVWERSRRG